MKNQKIRLDVSSESSARQIFSAQYVHKSGTKMLSLEISMILHSP